MVDGLADSGTPKHAQEDHDGAPPSSSNNNVTALSDLTDDLLEHILLRLSLEEELQCYRRAFLVCKSWHRVLSDPGFRRRYAGRHREEIRRQQRQRLGERRKLQL
jgi:hypothetical protein